MLCIEKIEIYSEHLLLDQHQLVMLNVWQALCKDIPSVKALPSIAHATPQLRSLLSSWFKQKKKLWHPDQETGNSELFCHLTNLEERLYNSEGLLVPPSSVESDASRNVVTALWFMTELRNGKLEDEATQVARKVESMASSGIECAVAWENWTCFLERKIQQLILRHTIGSIGWTKMLLGFDKMQMEEPPSSIKCSDCPSKCGLRLESLKQKWQRQEQTKPCTITTALLLKETLGYLELEAKSQMARKIREWRLKRKHAPISCREHVETLRAFIKHFSPKRKRKNRSTSERTPKRRKRNSVQVEPMVKEAQVPRALLDKWRTVFEVHLESSPLAKASKYEYRRRLPEIWDIAWSGSEDQTIAVLRTEEFIRKVRENPRNKKTHGQLSSTALHFKRALDSIVSSEG